MPDVTPEALADLIAELRETHPQKPRYTGGKLLTRAADALDSLAKDRDRQREALFRAFVNVGEDTDGLKSGAEFDRHVTPKLADLVPRLIREYRVEMEAESDREESERIAAEAEVAALRQQIAGALAWAKGAFLEPVHRRHVETLIRSLEATPAPSPDTELEN